VITYKKSGLAQTLASVPLEHLVLETDAPYLTPVPFRGKRNESAYIKIIAQHLADAKKTSIEEIARLTTANAEKIFRKKQG
jgi:TatD DNase family protein